MKDKFYILDIYDQSEWEVVEVDKRDPVVKEGWITARCINPGTDKKAFVNQKLQIPAMTVFERPERYDVSTKRFTSTTTLSGDEGGAQ